LTVTLFLQLLYGWSMTVHQDKFFWLVLGLLAAARNLVNESPSPDEFRVAAPGTPHPLGMTEAIPKYTT